MAGGIDSKYLKELQQVLEAEAALARDGIDLLADPEYCALRERFIDGDMPIDEFVGRVEGLAEIRPEESEVDASGRDDEDGADPPDDDPEDLDDLADLDDLRLLKDFRHPDTSGDGGSAGGDPDD